MIQVLGYIAMGCLIMAAVPQAIKAVREGHSNGIAGPYVLLLLSGFTLMSVYLCLTKPVYPVLFNYLFNILMMCIIGYYKLFPRNKNG